MLQNIIVFLKLFSFCNLAIEIVKKLEMAYKTEHTLKSTDRGEITNCIELSLFGDSVLKSGSRYFIDVKKSL